MLPLKKFLTYPFYVSKFIVVFHYIGPDFFFSTMDLVRTTITTLGDAEGVEGVRYVDTIPFVYS
jgi:hypothetical protein